MAAVMADLASLQLDDRFAAAGPSRRSSQDSTQTSHPAFVRPELPSSRGRESNASTSSAPSSSRFLSCELPVGMDPSELDAVRGADQAISALDWMAEYAKGNWDPDMIPAPFPRPSRSFSVSHSSPESIYTSPPLGSRAGLSESTLPSSPMSSLQLETELADEQKTYLKEGWLPAPRVENEDDRRRALWRSRILKKSSHAVLDKIVRLAQKTFGVKTVLIMMCEDDEFPVLSSYGYEAKSGPRGPSLCSHTILSKDSSPFVILDTHLDWRFKNHPYVVSGKMFRFYAGTALKSEDGHSLGSLCVIDNKPRESFSEEERQDLQDLGALVMREIELYTARQEVLQRTLTTESVDRLGHEVLEMKDANLTRVSSRASQHVRDALSIDGCAFFSLSAIECEPAGEEAAPSKPKYRVCVDGRTLFREDPSLPIDDEATFALLGSSEPAVNDVHSPVLATFSTTDHADVCRFLNTTGAGGKTYSGTNVPSWFRSPLPADTNSVLLLPIFSIDHTPIALLVAVSTDVTHEFSSGHRAYLDQIGAIVTSSFLRQRLIQSDTAKSIFVSNISHELRTPLHVIAGHCELLEQSTLTLEQERCLRSISSSCTTLSETVNHVLEFSKSAAHPTGKETAHQAEMFEVDLAQLVEEVVDEVHLARLPLFGRHQSLRSSSTTSGLASSPGSSASASISPSGSVPTPPKVETIIDIQPRLAGWFVRVDRAGLRRIVTNCLSNAMKYCDSGSITVSLCERAGERSPHHINVEIAVADTGRGMTKEYLQSNLFLPFSQEDSISPGAGLGLAMVKAVVESMPGGQIFVQSEKDVGSKFIVHLTLEAVTGIETPALSFGDGYEVDLVGFDADKPALAASRAMVEVQLHRWGFDLVAANGSTSMATPPSSSSTSPRRIAIVEESHGWDSFHLATLPPRLILLTSGQPTSPVDPAGRVYLRKPLGNLKLELALREVIRLHNPPPVLKLAPPVPSAASLSSVSVAISSSIQSTPSIASVDLPRPPPIMEETKAVAKAQVDVEVLAGRRMSHGIPSPRLPPPEVRPFKVLIVDDNNMNRRVLWQFLRKKNCVLAEAENGAIGADLFEKEKDEPYDFVLLDLQMPVLDGFDSCRRMRETERKRSTRSLVLALTGLSSSDDRKQAFTAGMDDYLVKPVSLKALWALLLSHTTASS